MRPVQWVVVASLCLGIVPAIIFTTSPVETFPVGWEKSFYVSPPYIAARAPRLVSRGNVVVAVFQGREVDKGKAGDYIYSSLSFNGGKSYIRPVKIAEVTGNPDYNPYAAISSLGHIAVSWQNIVEPKSSSRLFISVSRDMGANWSAPSQVGLIRDSATDSDMDMLPQVYYDDRNRLHLFYHSLRGDMFNLFHAVSEDGTVFSLPKKLVDVAEGLRGAFFPSVKLIGSSIYLVWQGRQFSGNRFTDDLFFMSSGNYGGSWSGSRRITSGYGSSASPSLEVYGSTVYVAYQNNREKTWGIWLSAGRNQGVKWDAAPVKVSDTNSNCYSPAVLQAENDELMLLWYDLRAKEPRLHARKYNIIENKLSDVSTISRAGVAAVNPVAVSVDRKIVVLWKEGDRLKTNYSDVYVAPPLVMSRTHPDNTWSRAPSALIEVQPPEDEAGIRFYSIVVNQDPNDNPPDVETLSGKLNRYQTPMLDDGVHYVHVRAIDNAGNVSKTVHYKLQISRSPLQVAELASPTHPEGKPEQSKAPRFKWDITPQDALRVKGFLVGLTKDRIAEPGTFTTDFSTEFNDLQEGRYFFNIRAVDKTNYPGTLYNYEIIVGQAEKLDLEYIKNIAKKLDKYNVYEEVTRPVMPGPPRPSFVLNFPFDTSRSFNGRNFEVFIAPRNIAEQNIAGYSVVLDTKKTMPGDNITLKSNVIHVKDLKNGTYHMAFKGKYHKMVGGKKQYYWTDPLVKTFIVDTPLEPSPVLAYSDGLFRKLAERWLLISLSMTGLVLSIVTVGFGSRLAFYLNLVRYRIQLRIK
jgi:hypothetical protein